MDDESWLSRAADVAEVTSLTTRLVAYKSYPGLEGGVQREIANWLWNNGLVPELQSTGSEDRPNVLVRLANGPGPTLLLNGHVDTVLAVDGWSSDPWQAQLRDGRLYGLGAGDMKGGVAAIMLATRALAEQRERWSGTVILSTVVDEEAYSIGARAMVESGITADACLVAESAWDHPTLGAVGKVLVRGDVVGRAAHGSRPAEGINAAVEAAKLVARLDEMPLGQHPRLRATQCVLSLHSGSEQYVITVPENAHFTINRHIVPGETGESVVAEMSELTAEVASPAQFDFAIDPPYYPPWEISSDAEWVRRFSRAYQAEAGQPPTFSYSPGVSDANYFAADLGIPTVIFGPRSGNGHQANEWVDVASLSASIRVILRLALDLLG